MGCCWLTLNDAATCPNEDAAGLGLTGCGVSRNRSFLMRACEVCGCAGGRGCITSHHQVIITSGNHRNRTQHSLAHSYISYHPHSHLPHTLNLTHNRLHTSYTLFVAAIGRKLVTTDITAVYATKIENAT